MLNNLSTHLHFFDLKKKISSITFYNSYEFESANSIPYNVIRMLLLLKLLAGIKPSYKLKNPEYKKYFLTCFLVLKNPTLISKFLNLFLFVIVPDRRLFNESIKLLNHGDSHLIFELKNLHLIFDKLNTHYNSNLNYFTKKIFKELSPSLFAEDSLKFRIELKNLTKNEILQLFSNYGFNIIDQ
jgi:hypothetical protein